MVWKTSAISLILAGWAFKCCEVRSPTSMTMNRTYRLTNQFAHWGMSRASSVKPIRLIHLTITSSPFTGSEVLKCKREHLLSSFSMVCSVIVPLGSCMVLSHFQSNWQKLVTMSGWETTEVVCTAERTHNWIQKKIRPSSSIIVSTNLESTMRQPRSTMF